VEKSDVDSNATATARWQRLQQLAVSSSWPDHVLANLNVATEYILSPYGLHVCTQSMCRSSVGSLLVLVPSSEELKRSHLPKPITGCQ
jgi:hypothetical protein